MDFGANITPVEVIKKEALAGTCFRDIIYIYNNYRYYEKSWK